MKAIRIKKFRYFFLFPEPYERFLNKMAEQGLRLVKVGLLFFYFEPCPQGEFTYQVLFVGEKSAKDNKHLRHYLEDSGYRVYTKNGFLPFHMGVKWRPYGKGRGQISTAPGSYYKEFTIVERNAHDAPCDLFTTHVDKVGYYRGLRNMFLFYAIFFFAMAGFLVIEVCIVGQHSGVSELYNAGKGVELVGGLAGVGTWFWVLFSLLFLVGCLFCIPLYGYAQKAKHHKALSLVEE